MSLRMYIGCIEGSVQSLAARPVLTGCCFDHYPTGITFIVREHVGNPGRLLVERYPLRPMMLDLFW